MSEKIVQLNEEVIKELVRGSVEEILNELQEKEAEQLTQAARDERSEIRQDKVVLLRIEVQMQVYLLLFPGNFSLVGLLLLVIPGNVLVKT